jgi:hypothetical protein
MVVVTLGVMAAGVMALGGGVMLFGAHAWQATERAGLRSRAGIASPSTSKRKRTRTTRGDGVPGPRGSVKTRYVICLSARPTLAFVERSSKPSTL